MEILSEISLSGFKIVSKDYFAYNTRTKEPTLTIWDGEIGFSKCNLEMMNKCESIIIRISTSEKKIIVMSSNSSDKDSVRWLKKLDPLEPRKITCARLTDKLYEQWGWDKNYIYRAVGRKVASNNRIAMLYDFDGSVLRWLRPGVKNGL